MNARKLSDSEKKIIAHSQEWKCGHCKDLLPASYQIDHIIPHAIGGNDDKSNLMALCPTCHSNKTQKENSRISKFKLLRAQTHRDICWFCLDENIPNHPCNKTLKPVITRPRISSLEKSFDQFIFIPKDDNTNELNFNQLNIDTTLRIRLTRHFIYVNNFFTKADITLDTIAEAVFISTRTKRESRKYTEVEITIEIEENTPDELVEYIDKNLHQKLTQRIFNPYIEIQYIYIVD